VMENRRSGGFAVKPRDELLVGKAPGQEHLDRDDPAEALNGLMMTPIRRDPVRSCSRRP
jgi:hypothetical protein